MAKGSNIITNGLSGTLGKLSFVKSKRYGAHVRSARGTFKPAVLNDSMASSSKRMATANIPAKAIFDAIRNDHRDGELWVKLVSVFRRQLKAGIPFHIRDLKNMECHDKSSLDKLIGVTDYAIAVHEKPGSLAIVADMKTHPSWAHLNWQHSFQYRLSVIAVFPDLEKGCFVKETAHGPVTSYTDAPPLLSFEIPVPPQGDSYLLFLLAEIYDEGAITTLPHGKGMRAVGMGTLIKDSLSSTR